MLAALLEDMLIQASGTNNAGSDSSYISPIRKACQLREEENAKKRNEENDDDDNDNN